MSEDRKPLRAKITITDQEDGPGFLDSSGSARGRVFDPKDVSSDDINSAALGMLVIHDICPENPACSGDEELPCSDLCQCYISMVTGAVMEVLLQGPNKEDASMFLQETFIEARAKNRVLH